METQRHRLNFKADYVASTKRFALPILTGPSGDAVRSHQAIDNAILLVAVEVRSARILTEAAVAVVTEGVDVRVVDTFALNAPLNASAFIPPPDR